MTSAETTRHFGDLLKQRRTELNMTLKEAENATSIRISYLDAIEKGDVQKLISPVYAQGFIRQYSSFLGVDPEKVITDHPELFTCFENQEFSYGIGTLEMRNSPGGGGRVVPNLLYGGAFLVVLSLAWFLARYLDLI